VKGYSASALVLVEQADLAKAIEADTAGTIGLAGCVVADRRAECLGKVHGGLIIVGVVIVVRSVRVFEDALPWDLEER